MNQSDADKQLRNLIAKAFLPPDLCPTDPAAIEAMLDATEGEPFTDEQVERMLLKAKGELPVGERGEDQEPERSEAEVNREEESLIALYRRDGGELPPEIKEKLRRFREKTHSDSKEEEGSEH
jgi:hypothetical protein